MSSSTESSSRLLRTVSEDAGVLAEIAEYEYDGNGNLIKESYDYNADGMPDEVYEYNSDGNITNEYYEYDADGVIDETYKYEYDANGNEIKSLADYDNDGTPDRISTYEYDSNGNRTRRSIDKDGDGSLDEVYEYKYDDNGNRLKESYDKEADGTPDRIYESEYDSNGNQIKRSSDRNADGNPEQVNTYEYDDNGNRIKQSRDDDNDGTPEQVDTYEYDDNGNLTKSSFVSRWGASFYEYEYDDNSNKIKESISRGGTIQSTKEYEYDSNGNQIKESFDKGGDGTLDDIKAYEYDSNGNKIKESRDKDADGTPDKIYKYEYDSNNNLIKESRDNDGDGVYDYTTSSIYSAELRASEVSGALDIASIGSSQSLQLSFDDFNLAGVGELLVFSLNEDGSKTQLASFFTLENGKLPSDFSTSLDIDKDLLSFGQIQFELVENGNVRAGTVKVQGDAATIAFSEDTYLSVSFNNEATAPNLLREDATTLDLTGHDGGDVTLNFSVFREASYDSSVGFYRTDDAEGGIKDPMTGETLRPGDEGYKDAALSRQLEVQLSGQNGEMSTFSTTLEGGGFLGMFLISDGNDATSGDLLFSHMGMNDGNDHVKMLGNNTFGFEDMVGMGDGDFNDMVVKVEAVV